MRFSAALEQVYQPLLELLVSHTSDQPIVGNIERIANFLARELASLINEEGSKEKPTVGKLSKWREKYFELTSSGAIVSKDYIKNKSYFRSHMLWSSMKTNYVQKVFLILPI